MSHCLQTENILDTTHKLSQCLLFQQHNKEQQQCLIREFLLLCFTFYFLLQKYVNAFCDKNIHIWEQLIG